MEYLYFLYELFSWHCTHLASCLHNSGDHQQKLGLSSYHPSFVPHFLLPELQKYPCQPNLHGKPNLSEFWIKNKRIMGKTLEATSIRDKLSRRKELIKNWKTNSRSLLISGKQRIAPSSEEDSLRQELQRLRHTMWTASKRSKQESYPLLLPFFFLCLFLGHNSLLLPF